MVGFIHYIHTTVVQCCPDGVTAASMIQALAAGSLCDLSDCLTDQTQRESEQLFKDKHEPTQVTLSPQI